MDAARLGLIVPLLVGPKAKIEAVARKFGIELGAAEIVDVPHSHAAAERAVALVREGRAEALMSGNMLAKSLSFLAGADAAGIVLGARVPIILTSRADSVMTRLASCAVAVAVAAARRAGAVQAV